VVNLASGVDQGTYEGGKHKVKAEYHDHVNRHEHYSLQISHKIPSSLSLKLFAHLNDFNGQNNPIPETQHKA
jgi:hypothetical protein